jgi:hypothetical protein
LFLNFFGVWFNWRFNFFNFFRSSPFKFFLFTEWYFDTGWFFLNFFFIDFEKFFFFDFEGFFFFLTEWFFNFEGFLLTERLFYFFFFFFFFFWEIFYFNVFWNSFSDEFFNCFVYLFFGSSWFNKFFNEFFNLLLGNYFDFFLFWFFFDIFFFFRGFIDWGNDEIFNSFLDFFAWSTSFHELVDDCLDVFFTYNLWGFSFDGFLSFFNLESFWLIWAPSWNTISFIVTKISSTLPRRRSIPR